MQDIVANCDNNRFDIELALEQQLGAQSLPFPGMDKSGASVCTFYLKNLCSRGNACPLRHVTGTQSVVCKHWLRGLCKKGDACEFLHEYDMSKMPECYFYARLGQCCNKECPFLHIDPESKIKDCAWYDRGFCRHGPLCKNRHVRRVICRNYIFGFCIDGKECKYQHPRFEIPTLDPSREKKPTFVCHACGEVGHKSAWCLKKNLLNPAHNMIAGAQTAQVTSQISPQLGIQQRPGKISLSVDSWFMKTVFKSEFNHKVHSICGFRMITQCDINFPPKENYISYITLPLYNNFFIVKQEVLMIYPLH